MKKMAIAIISLGIHTRVRVFRDSNIMNSKLKMLTNRS
jgi:hypothetical protein